MTRYKRSHQAGLASGPVNTTAQIGGALGLAAPAPAKSADKTKERKNPPTRLIKQAPRQELTNRKGSVLANAPNLWAVCELV